MTAVQERTGLLLPEPALAFAGLLGVDAPDLEDGAPLPLLWHWLYLLERPASADLGEDGHSVRNAVPAPPGPGRRRMFAGGRVRWTGPLRCGEAATRRSTVAATVEKHGRSGAFTLVTVQHQISQRGEVLVHEEQDILYRDAAPFLAAGDPQEELGTRTAPETSGAHVWRVATDPVLLFRYSALTYNGHRIHYDRDFARNEGYPGLVVHGPLQAMLMTESSRRLASSRDPATSFEFRLLAPAFDGVDLLVEVANAPTGDAVVTGVRTATGHATATGRLSWAD